MKKLRPAFKIHGGKHYLQPWIIEHFPKDYEQYNYIEPFIGGASVFLNKTPSIAGKHEIINDLDTGIIKIYQALRDEPDHFIKSLKKITYCERVFNRELKRQTDGIQDDDYIVHAINEFVVRRMSRGGLKKAFAWSERERGGQPGDVNAWKTIMQALPDIAERLKDALILNKPAVKVISAFDSEDTLCYCDPPYDPDTRTSKSVYGHEMTTDDHIELAQTLMRFNGKVIINGYPSTLYNRLYEDWKCVKKKIVNHASQKKTKEIKTEVCWMNY